MTKSTVKVDEIVIEKPRCRRCIHDKRFRVDGIVVVLCRIAILLLSAILCVYSIFLGIVDLQNGAFPSGWLPGMLFAFLVFAIFPAINKTLLFGWSVYEFVDADDIVHRHVYSGSLSQIQGFLVCDGVVDFVVKRRVAGYLRSKGEIFRYVARDDTWYPATWTVSSSLDYEFGIRTLSSSTMRQYHGVEFSGLEIRRATKFMREWPGGVGTWNIQRMIEVGQMERAKSEYLDRSFTKARDRIGELETELVERNDELRLCEQEMGLKEATLHDVVKMLIDLVISALNDKNSENSVHGRGRRKDLQKVLIELIRQGGAHTVRSEFDTESVLERIRALPEGARLKLRNEVLEHLARALMRRIVAGEAGQMDEGIDSGYNSAAIHDIERISEGIPHNPGS